MLELIEAKNNADKEKQMQNTNQRIKKKDCERNRQKECEME